MKVKGRGRKLTLICCVVGLFASVVLGLFASMVLTFYLLFFYCHILKLKDFLLEVCHRAQARALLQVGCLGPLGV